MTRKILCGGAALTCVTTDRFKTNVLAAFFIRPLSEDEAALNALLPPVLRRGNSKLPTLADMSNRLADLSGTGLYAVVRKLGERHCIGLISDFIGGENLNNVAELLFDTLFTPVFSDAFVLSERDNLLSQIRALKNNKASFAAARHNALAFAGEPYSATRLGGEERAGAITPEALRHCYQKTLDSSALEFFYCGPADPERVENLILKNLPIAPRKIEKLAATFPTNENRRDFSESENISQAQLSIIWRTGITAENPDYFPANIACAIYGGSSASKLFTHVRERLSLCYTTNSSINRHKGLMRAQSGVDTAMLSRATDEMLTQWDDVVSGRFSDEEFNSAVSLIVNELKSVNDSPAALESFWQSQSVYDLCNTPNDWITAVLNVRKEDVLRVAKGFKLDSTYCLRAVQ
ncbi:MAG: insulinase family protein [Oscillospiraceae bacterium]|nr:insulinase family protein [Oscillospiraceae bacterium]